MNKANVDFSLPSGLHHAALASPHFPISAGWREITDLVIDSVYSMRLICPPRRPGRWNVPGRCRASRGASGAVRDGSLPLDACANALAGTGTLPKPRTHERYRTGLINGQ
jgi:hypothetical protein